MTEGPRRSRPRRRAVRREARAPDLPREQADDDLVLSLSCQSLNMVRCVLY
jgi:hypothetical protein